ncbi:MAG: hypothetical protein IKU72_05460 [Oscillospiraceae bacterium]|nr:hypothetical protein [Oscillospiraceae bacterium]
MSCCSSLHKTDHTVVPTEHDLTNNCTAVYQTAQCRNNCINLQNGCGHSSCCEPIPATPLCSREYRLCTDSDGCAAHYPIDCRNRFWPNFSHPRWLPCSCLYCTGRCCTKRCNH